EPIWPAAAGGRLLAGPGKPVVCSTDRHTGVRPHRGLAELQQVPIYACCLRVLHRPDIWNRHTLDVSGKLIVSVSGIGERTLADVDAFCTQMDARSVPVSLLVAPRLSGDYRLDRDPRTVDWLINRRSGGDAIVLHGYDDAATKKRRAEFAMLRTHEA